MVWRIKFERSAERELDKPDRQIARRILVYLHGRVATLDDPRSIGEALKGSKAGAQFAASLVSRIWAGSYSDKHGAKRGVVSGFIAAAVSGLLYLLSLGFVGLPVVSVTILLIGRAVLGRAESFIITGGVSWGLALVDKEHAGKVIAWVGTAMFAAMAFGGPFGTMMFDSYGFTSISLITTLLPLAVLTGIVRIPAVAPHPRKAQSALKSVVDSGPPLLVSATALF
jgi:MFS family permease